MSRVLVTGAAGFIGSHVCEGLTAANRRVRGVDAYTETYAPAVKRRNIAAVLQHPGFEMVAADLLDADLGQLLDGVDVVVHLAGECGVTTSWGADFRSYVERNVLGTEALLAASVAAGVRKFVYASSSSVYRPSWGPVREGDPVGPVSPYGVSKLAGECLVNAYAAERGLPTACLRFFSVYGPRQRPDMAAHRFIDALLDGRDVQVFGEREQLRDFTYVADVAAAVLASVERELPPGVVLNVAHGVPVAVTEVLRILGEELGLEPRVRRLPHRHGDTPSTHGDPAAAQRLLGWRAETDIRVGLRQQLAWQVAHRLPSRRAPVTSLGAPRLAATGAERVTSGHEPRLLIYSQDGLGLGHLRRTTLLAGELLTALPGSSALTLSDSPLGHFFDTAPGHDYLKLPSIRKSGPGDWHPVSLSSRFTDVLAMRRQIIASAVESFDPQVLLVDHMPHGAMGELVGALRMLRDRPARIVLGLRDILDAPETVRERWRAEGAFDALEEFYDDVLVYGSRDVLDVAEEYGWSTGAAERVHYCGYVCAPVAAGAPRSIRSRYLRDDAGKLVLVMAGGGADAYPLFSAVLDAAADLHRVTRAQLLMVTGPFMPAAQRRALARAARGLPVTMVSTVANSPAYMAAADLVVAMAGYNTTVEILGAGTPALLVPRRGPSAEQRLRARLFAERGWVRWVSPEHLDDGTLAPALIAAALDIPSQRSPRRPDLVGRQAAAARLVRMLDPAATSPDDDVVVTT